MSKGTVNKVILIGRLGVDPEVRYTQTGVAFANLRLATNHSQKESAGGQYFDVTEWHRVVLIGKGAEVIQQYAKKGSSLYIEGRIRTQKWQDKEGRDQYTTEIVANEFQFIGGTGNNSNNDDQMAMPSTEPMVQQSSQQAPSNNLYAQAKGNSPSSYNPQPKPQSKPVPDINEMTGFADDDIPF